MKCKAMGLSLCIHDTLSQPEGKHLLLSEEKCGCPGSAEGTSLVPRNPALQRDRCADPMTVGETGVRT